MAQAAGTYTIAYDRESGSLLACVADGADLDAALIAEEGRAGCTFDRDLINVESGLILTDDADEQDTVLYRRHYSLGWLTDTRGTPYDLAVRRA